MSRQRDALNQIMPGLCRKYPGCGILVFGSVGRREERPDSDLDIMVVYEGDGDLTLDHGVPIGPPDVNVDLVIFPENAFRRIIEKKWFGFWEFSQAEIIHDPTGIAERNQAIVRERMRKHPEVAHVWEAFVEAVQRSKKETGVKQPFEKRSELEDYLERLLKEESTAHDRSSSGDIQT